MKPTQKLGIGAQILAARLTGSVRPFFVQYSLLNGCNARCVYCNSPSRKDPQLATEQHRKLLGEFAQRAGPDQIGLDPWCEMLEEHCERAAITCLGHCPDQLDQFVA